MRDANCRGGRYRYPRWRIDAREYPGEKVFAYMDSNVICICLPQGRPLSGNDVLVYGIRLRKPQRMKLARVAELQRGASC